MSEHARNTVVVIAASAGGLDPLRAIVAALHVPCAASVFIVWHIGAHPSELPTILQHSSAMPVVFAEDGAEIAPGHVYVAPPDRHVLLEATRMRLSSGPKVHFARPAADPMFISAAATHGDRVIGIVLSGGDGDGAEGLLAIKQHGGKVFVQNPAEALAPSMPHAAIAAVHPDAVLSIREIARLVGGLCSRPVLTMSLAGPGCRTE
jgi:two-component system chemotaxis response regulator CheB